MGSVADEDEPPQPVDEGDVVPLTGTRNFPLAAVEVHDRLQHYALDVLPDHCYSNVQKATFALSISKWRKGKKWGCLRNTARLENIASIQNS